MAAKDSLHADQFTEALDIVARSRGMLTPENTKKVFKAVNIRSWPLTEQPSSMPGRDAWTEERGGVVSNEELNTAQDYLHGPTVRDYMKDGGVPEVDPHYDDERAYLPEVHTSLRGHKWIDEGHHRIVASRLRGDNGTEVYEGPLL